MIEVSKERAMKVPCPTCGARAGEMCTKVLPDSVEDPTRVHAARSLAADKAA